MMRAMQVALRRGGRWPLQDITLDLREGEVLVLLGPNGAGKSSLLRVLSGEWRPSAGTVSFDGIPLAQWDSREIAKRRAVLPQEHRPGFALTALELVLIGRYPHNDGWPGRGDAAIARAALRRTDAEHLAHRPYPALSGGERARVQLARCLCQIWSEPDSGGRYLLLDEPTASLDPAHQHMALSVARDFAGRERVGVCVVLHDLNLASRYADRIAILDDGRLAACGPPRAVLTEDRLACVFRVKAEVIPGPDPDRPLVSTTAAVSETDARYCGTE